MADNVSLNAVLNLSLGAITRGREAEREIAGIMSQGTATGAAQGFKKASGELESTWAKLLQSGMRKQGEELRKAYASARREQQAASAELMDVQKKLNKVKDEGTLRELRLRKDALTKEIKRQSKAQKNLINAASKAADQRMDLLEQHERRMSQTRLGGVKAGGEKFAELVQQGMSLDQLDPSSLVEKLSGALAGGARMGAGAAGAAGLSGAASALTAAAGSITAVTAPLAAVFAVIGAGYGQTKELNKALLDSATAADLLGENTEDIRMLGAEYDALNVRLKMLRRVTIDAAYDFRMSKDEVSGYIGALNEAGLTVNEFRGIVSEGTSDMKAYTDVTRTAILASQGLGISASETGDFMNKMTRDLGADLTDVQGAFGMIFSEARKAGMSTKDFFAVMNEASSGMALYNFRLSDTLGLFTDLVDILGEDLAKQQIGLEGTFRQMGMQQRVKTTMLMGTDRARGIASADAKAQGREFAKSFGDLPGIGNLGDPEMLKRLGGMSGEEFRRVYAGVSDPAAKRQLVSIRELSKSLDGGFMDVAQSLGSLSKTGELAAQLSQGAALSGGEALSEMSGRQQMMIQEALGIGGDQFETLKRLDIGLRSEFESMRASAADGDEILSMTFEEALAGGLLSQSKVLEEGAELQYSLMERTAQDQLMETRSLTQTVSNQIASLLENVWIGVEHLVTLFGNWVGGQDEDLALRRQSMQAEEEQRALLEKLGQDIFAKKGEITSEDDPARRAALREELASLEAQAAGAREKMSMEKDVRRKISSGGGATARRDVMAERFAEQFGMSPEEFVGSQSFAKQSKMGIGAGERVSVGLGTATGYKGIAAAGHIGRSGVLSAVGDDLKSGAITPEKAREMGFEVAVEPLQELTAEQIETITAQAEEDRMQAENLAKKQEDKQDETTNAVEQLTGIMEREQLAKITGATGLTPEKLQQLMMQGEAGQAQIVNKLRAAATGPDAQISEAQAREYGGLLDLNVGRDFNDFIYRGDGTRGTINPIDSQDQFFGAKPGGPIAGAMGGNKTVYINVNGGDEARVYQVIKKVLQETGYSDMRSY